MSKLTDLASQMRKEVAAHPSNWRAMTLPGGLDIVLSHQAESWRLALRRERVVPSATEVEILREAFGAPVECVAEVRAKTEQHPVTKRTIRWQVVELRWREL